MTVAEVGWLCLGGVEIVHDARVLSYLHRGLAGGGLASSVQDVAITGVESGIVEAPYHDLYSDAYGEEFSVDCASGFAPPCLRCGCTALVLTETFDDPASDDAPWYQSSAARSADFLGAMALSVDVLPPTARTQQLQSRFGGVPSPTKFLPRVMQVSARLYAVTPAGLEWGRRWLTDVLVGACDDTPADARFLPYCPAENVDSGPFRQLADCVLVDGPTWTDVGLFNDFRVQDVRFQLASSAPWLLGLPVECDSRLLGSGASMSCLIETESWGGSQAVKLTLSGDLEGVVVRAVPLTSDQTYPVSGTAMPCSEFTVGGTQVGDVLVVDASRHSALLTDVTSKRDVSAISYLDFDGPFSWMEAPPCTRMCVTITNHGTGTLTATVETVVTEL